MNKPIGYISYTHGLDGKVKIVPMVIQDEFKEYVKNNNIYIKKQDKFEKIKVDIVVFNGKVFLCKIKDICNINEARQLLKNEIFAYIEDEDNFINVEKLVGFDVFIEDNKEIYGKVVDFGNYGCGMLIEIKTKKGKNEFYSCNNDANSEIISVNYKNKIVILKKREVT